MIQWLRGRPILLSFQTELDPLSPILLLYTHYIHLVNNSLPSSPLLIHLYGAQDFFITQCGVL